MKVYDAIKEPVWAMDVNERGFLHLYLVVGARKSDDETLKKMPAEWRGAWKALGDTDKERWENFIRYIGRDLTPYEAANLLVDAFSEGFRYTDDYLKILDETIKFLTKKVWKIPPPVFVGDDELSEMERVQVREEWLLVKLLEAAWQRLKPEDKERIAELVKKLLKDKGFDAGKAGEISALLLQGGLTALREVLGFQFHIILAQVFNAIMRALARTVLIEGGVSLAVNATVQRLAAIIFGPLGWVISVILFIDILAKLIYPREWQRVLPAIVLIAQKRLEMRA